MDKIDNRVTHSTRLCTTWTRIHPHVGSVLIQRRMTKVVKKKEENRNHPLFEYLRSYMPSATK